MHSVRGRVIAVQEGRFRLVTDDGRVMPFVLSHKAGPSRRICRRSRHGRRGCGSPIRKART